jgi:hypothetical protein
MDARPVTSALAGNLVEIEFTGDKANAARSAGARRAAACRPSAARVARHRQDPRVRAYAFTPSAFRVSGDGFPRVSGDNCFNFLLLFTERRISGFAPVAAARDINAARFFL